MNNNVIQENILKSANINIMTEILEKIGRMLIRDFNEIRHIAFEKRRTFIEKYESRASDMIMNFLHQKRPQYGIISKSQTYQEDEDIKWIINPLSGIENFAHNINSFCCSIAIMEDDRIIASMILDPLSREMFYAESGKGAFLNHKLMHVSRNIYSNKSLFGTIKDVGLNYRKIGCPLLDLAYVACGRFDGCITKVKHICDYAAGILLASESKAKIKVYSEESDSITNDELSPLHPTKSINLPNYLICSNEKLHEYMLTALNEFTA
ncbi:inositol monophosphatase family protein [Candidatus Cytomitobacter primus]|nr:inositol monophosphatase [Candidatus Cytomitobacter primus]